MKRIAILLLAALPLIMSAQEKVPKEANRFTYHQYEYGDRTDTTVITVIRDGQRITILSPEPQGRKIQGYCHTVTTVDYEADSITVTAAYDDSSYYYRTALSRSDIEWRVDNGEWKTSINSNTLIFKMDDNVYDGRADNQYFFQCFTPPRRRHYTMLPEVESREKSPESSGPAAEHKQRRLYSQSA